MPSLITTLGLSAAAFHAGARGAKASVSSLGESISKAFSGISVPAAGAFAGVWLKKLAGDTQQAAVEIHDLSARLGMSTESIQRWGIALDLAGGKASDLPTFFEKLATAQQKAVGGDAKLAETFKQYGIAIDDLKSKRPGEVGEMLAKAMTGMDPAKVVTDLKRIGGKSAGALVAAFTSGGVNDALSGALGETMGKGDIANMAAFDDWKALQKRQQKAAIAKPLGVLGKGAMIGTDWVTGLLASVPNAVIGGFKKDATMKEGFFKAWDEKKKARDMLFATARTPVTGGAGVDVEAQIEKEERIAELKAKIEDKKKANSTSEMSAEEKLNALKRERRELERKMSWRGGLDEEGRLGVQSELLDLDKKILNAETAIGKEAGAAAKKAASEENSINKEVQSEIERQQEQNAKLGSHSVGSFQQMGGFLGNFNAAAAPETAAMNAQIESRDILREIRDTMKKGGKIAAHVGESDVEF